MRLSKDPEARARQLEAAEQIANLTPEQIEEGRTLVKEGWKQLSRKYRHIARVAPGYTAVEALAAVDSKKLLELEEESKRRIEMLAAEYLCSCNSNHPLVEPNRRTLDIPAFAAFRKAGGGSL